MRSPVSVTSSRLVLLKGHLSPSRLIMATSLVLLIIWQTIWQTISPTTWLMPWDRASSATLGMMMIWLRWPARRALSALNMAVKERITNILLLLMYLLDKRACSPPTFGQVGCLSIPTLEEGEEACFCNTELWAHFIMSIVSFNEAFFFQVQCGPNSSSDSSFIDCRHHCFLRNLTVIM